MSLNLNRTLNQFTATELASLLSEAQCPSDIIRDCLKRIKLRNPKVKAWKYINDKIEQQLNNLNQAKTLSPLSGIQWRLKIILIPRICLQNTEPLFVNFQPQEDTEVINILRIRV